MSLKLIDCNCSFGKTVYTEPGSYYEKSDLLSKMNKFNVEKALVYHSSSKQYNSKFGNELLSQEILSDDNLLPIYALTPSDTSYYKDFDVLNKELKGNDVKGIRMFPSSHSFSLKEYSCGETYDYLESINMPIFIDFDETHCDVIDDILSNHKDLKIIMCYTGYRGDRYIYPMLKKHKNFFIETSRYSVFQGIESINNKYGVDNVLYGTSSPSLSMASGVYLMETLLIGEDNIEKIAHKNIERIIGGITL